MVGLLENMRVNFPFPEDGKALALRVILQAGKIDKCLLPTGLSRWRDAFNEISPRADFDNLPRFRDHPSILKNLRWMQHELANTSFSDWMQMKVNRN
jgi:hypothetical protein